jgi:hypothetical protein
MLIGFFFKCFLMEIATIIERKQKIRDRMNA